MSYGWGDDSGSSGSGYSGGSSSDDDYSSARKAYDDPKPASSRKPSASRSSRSSSSSKSASRTSERSYDFYSARGKTPSPIERKTLAVHTDSTHPLVVCVDHTGSFRTEVGIILEKLPLLGDEVARYAPNAEICLSLVGDALCDTQPLQVRDFDKGPPLTEHVKQLYPEGGGGDTEESYDLAAYYFVHHCEIPNAVKPIFVWVLDAPTRSSLRKVDIKRYIGDDVNDDQDSVAVLRELTKKFNVYVILQGSGSFKSFWLKVVDDQHIIPLSEPRDIIEMIIGIVAGEMGKFDDFEMRSSKRHGDKPDRISRVSRSLKSVKEKSKTGSGDGTAERADSGKSKKKSLKSKKLV